MALVQTGRRGVVVNVEHLTNNGGPGSGPNPGETGPEKPLEVKGNIKKMVNGKNVVEINHRGAQWYKLNALGPGAHVSVSGKMHTFDGFGQHWSSGKEGLKTHAYFVPHDTEAPTANASKAKPMEKSPDPADNDPVYAAKQGTEMAKAKEKDEMAKAQLANDHVKAKEMSTDARSRSKDAFDTKPNSKAGKDAHATAAMAHDDAAGAYSKLAGAGSGNDIETRGKCQKMADKHAEQSEKHKSLAEGTGGFGGPAMNSGSRSVVVTVNRDVVVGGLDDDFPDFVYNEDYFSQFVTNVWSEEAREAAKQARSMGHIAKTESSHAENVGSMSQDAHFKAHTDAADAHDNAASAHRELAAHLSDGGHEGAAKKMEAKAQEHDAAAQAHREVA